jgi:ABC-type glycerol-3-phosphate transport system substrate-binding protein
VQQLIRIVVANAIAAGIPANGATEINHWLWDANQAPSYQACADSRDNVPTDIYVGGLVKVWGRGAKQYGLPKDWDTIGIVYNRAMLEKAGIDPKSLWNLDWNPTASLTSDSHRSQSRRPAAAK